MPPGKNACMSKQGTNRDLVPPKPATTWTKRANAKFAETLDFQDTSDFDDATRNPIARMHGLSIPSDADPSVTCWDMTEYEKFITQDTDAPDTVNPSLWRNAQLCMIYGLFKVMDGIYQVRGYDLSNITFVRGETGWIVFDPLISAECARAAYRLVKDNIEDLPVVALIYSHSHVDHFGGAHGVINEDDANENRVLVLASKGFTEHALSENVIAGNAMARRAVFMYGSLLPRNASGGVNSGLGQTTSNGSKGLILPNAFVTDDEKSKIRTIDGVRMEFQFTPGTEAPTEMNTYFPDKNALWMAENTTHTMHNILTLRGALVRDALKWAEYLQETIDKWGSSDVKFQSHHWPVWGKGNVLNYLTKQRDTYKFIHDQSVRLMNQGFVGSEISEQLRLPSDLHKNWSSRGYYGTLSHNSRAVYQRYMGWYNGNPSDLNNHAPEYAAHKYVEYMGSSTQIMEKAQRDFNKGDYRWVAEVMKHVVFDNPEDIDARHLLADALEQLGYQAESGAWRSVYLQGAYELRNGVPQQANLGTASPDTIKNMDTKMLFDYLAVHVLPAKAEGNDFTMNMLFPDLINKKEQPAKYTLTMGNSVLSYTTALKIDVDVTVIVQREILNALILKEMTAEEAVKEGKLRIAGNPEILPLFLGMLDKYEPRFNIVTP